MTSNRAEVFDGKFGVREIMNCFVRVNIEDDVYVQADKQNTSTELVFDEFFEVLCRIHHTREGGQRTKRLSAKRLLESGEEGLELARSLDVWLGESLLPKAFAAMKMRKKGR